MLIFTFIILFLLYGVKRLITFHQHINGQWTAFLFNWFLLRRYSQFRPKDRLSLHDVYSNEFEHFGFMPFKEEDQYSKPKKNQTEHLFILAVNTGENTRLKVNFIRTPLAQTSLEFENFDPLKDNVKLELNYYDSKGEEYFIDQTGIFDHSESEYRAFGFAFEPIQANKLGRIKFRGYVCRRSDDTVHYVKMRLLCTSFNIVLDHSYIRNHCFMIQEMMLQSSLDNSVSDIKSILDDRQEQWSHLRGTVQFEQNSLEEIHFISTVGRRLYDCSSAIENITHMWAYTKNGYGLYLGVVMLNSGKLYRYGIANQRNFEFCPMNECSLKSADLLSLLQNPGKENNQNLSGQFGDKNLIIKIEEKNNRIKVNGDDGTYFVTVFTPLQRSSRKLEQKAKEYEAQNDIVVDLKNQRAKLVQLCGGKGASLSHLFHLSKKENSNFNVPNAIIVTTEAYQKQTENNEEFQKRLNDLRKVAYDFSDDKSVELEILKKESEKLQKWFEEQELLTEIKNEIEKNILSEFGDKDQLKKSGTVFAVRSSASTEDSEEMSTAGQMSTLLGVHGKNDHLAKAVMTCWASQFGFVAIQYKRGYGQDLNSPMAVVIQEMIDSQSAGVVFTAQPTTGDERILTITSNFGLGESVVSATADPDTFEVEIDVRKKSRKAISISKKNIGSKSFVTRLIKNSDEELNEKIENISNEKSIEFSDKSSLSDELILQVANCSLDIQLYYGNARDIEWGIVNKELYIFQSRPITNLDSGYTDYEIMHEIDTAHDSETEIYSRSHWGENFPGSGSLCASLYFQSPSVMTRQMIMQGTLKEKDFNVFKSPMGMVCQQLMFNMRYGMFSTIFNNYPKNEFSKAQVLSFFGRHITDERVLSVFRENYNSAKKYESFFKEKIIQPILLLYIIFFAQKNLTHCEDDIFKKFAGTLLEAAKRVPLKYKYRIVSNIANERMKAVKYHGLMSIASGIKSLILKRVLSYSCTNQEIIEQDLNLLMSNCSNVVSAEVPNKLRLIAKKIVDKQAFIALNDKDALEELRSGRAGQEAKEIFLSFLKDHEHRGYREFDPYYKPWGWDPSPCVQVIISMLKGGANLNPKEELSISEIIKQLKNPLNWWQKMLLEKGMLSWCRAGVGYREKTKSMMIRLGHDMRIAFWHIAREMAKNGLIPEVDLFFFLEIYEIEALLNGIRDPMIIKKAKHRLRIYPTINGYKFDEFQYGFKMHPRKKKPEQIIIDDSVVKLTGTSVTVGSVKARVCVAENIENAHQIQQGDILITYSTDIGWSPYFPIVSGIVTEIGGTISHGAVIAREFGIPCLIAVDNACHVFKTGDIAFLDTNNGSIVKIKQ